jgi:hypothetical protein
MPTDRSFLEASPMSEPKLLKTIFTYPWDLHDDGIDRALDVIQTDAQLNGVSLAVAYHLATYFLPHNPRRKVYFGEDGMVLFLPDGKHWSKVRLRPRVSQLVENKDWLPRLTEAIKKRGLHFTAWTVYCYNHYLARTFPDCARRDALDNPHLAQLCPANPEVQQYVLALTADITANYKPDAFYLESLCYLPFAYGLQSPKILTPLAPRDEFLLGLCFCEHCQKAAGEGLDTAQLRKDVGDWLHNRLPRMPTEEDKAPADEEWINTAFDSRLQHYLAGRMQAATTLHEEVVKRIRAHGAIRIESSLATRAEQPMSGLYADRVNKVTDRLGVGVPSQAEQVRAQRRGLAADKKLVANIQPAHVSSETAIQETVQAARQAGVDGFTFYNYGLIRMEQLRWIGEACRRGLM